MIRRSVCALAVAFVAGMPAWADGPSAERSPLDGILRAMDVVPSRAQVVSVVPYPVMTLEAAALDLDRSTYERTRAVTLLSLFAGPEARAALERLLQSGDADVRRLALYTLARTFGDEAGPALALQVAAYFVDPDTELVREAIRSLRWVDDDAARVQLLAFREQASPELQALIDQTLERRTTRLAADPVVAR